MKVWMVAVCLLLASASTLAATTESAKTPPPSTTSTVSGNSYIFANGAPLASRQGADIRFYHTDSTDSIVGISGHTNTSNQSYLPFGGLIGSDPEQDLGFGGHTREENLDAWYAGARFMQSQIGRFDATDPVIRPHQSTYMFGANSPMNMVDPSGALELPVRNSELIYPGDASSHVAVVYMREQTYHTVLETGQWGADAAQEVYVTTHLMPAHEVEEKLFQLDSNDLSGPQTKHRGKGAFYIIFDREGLEFKPGGQPLEMIHQGPINLEGRVLSAGINEFSQMRKLTHQTKSIIYRPRPQATTNRATSPSSAGAKALGALGLLSAGIEAGRMFSHGDVQGGMCIISECFLPPIFFSVPLWQQMDAVMRGQVNPDGAAIPKM